MQNQTKNPIWAWIMLVFGGLFVVTGLPGNVIMLIYAFFKPEDLSGTYIIFLTIGTCILVAIIWGMVKAIKAIRNHRKEMKIQESQPEYNEQNPPKKAIWPWVVIGLGGVTIIGMGPGALMLPIMPLFLAGMSTDSGTTPDYIPLTILFVGYGILIGYTILLIMAILKLRDQSRRAK